ncbi:hypothetical protein [Thermococcus sp.]
MVKLDEVEVIFYIEAMGNEKKALEMAIRETVKSLEKETTVNVKRVEAAEVIENKEEDLLKYSSIIEAVIAGPFENVIKAVLKYAPAVVELLKPKVLEIKADELMKIMGEISFFMSKLMDKYGGLAAYPKLDDIPMPRIGYDEEEIEGFILDDRNIRYRFVIETFGKELEEVRTNMAKAFFLEGCRINSILVQEQGEGEAEGNKYFLVAAELLSDFETMFQLNAKYSPVAISIVEPELIDINANELQGALTDLAGFVHSLVHRPLLKKLKEQDTFKFKLE